MKLSSREELVMLAPYVALVAAVFLGAVVSGFSGFAFSAVAGAILLRFVSPTTAVPLMMACSIATQALSMARLRQKLEWGRSLPLLAGGCVGVPLALYLFDKIDAHSFRIGFGVFLVLYCAYMLLRPAAGLLRGEVTRIGGAVVGFAGALVGGLTAMPGALPTIWCDTRGLPKEVQRATVQPFIAIMQIWAILLIIYTRGTAEGIPVTYLLVAMPALVVGTLTGTSLFGKVDDVLFRKSVLTLLVISGLGLIW